MTGPQCMGCGKPRDIPASAAITPCTTCGSTGIVTYWPLTPVAPNQAVPSVVTATITTYSNGTAK